MIDEFMHALIVHPALFMVGIIVLGVVVYVLLTLWTEDGEDRVPRILLILNISCILISFIWLLVVHR